MYNQVIELSSNSSKQRWVLIFGALCMFLVGIAWTQHIPTTQISFEVVSPNVKLVLSKDWSQNEVFKAEYISIDNLDTIRAPQLERKFQRDIENEQETALMKLKGSSIMLSELFFEKGIILTLTQYENTLTLKAQGKKFSGKFKAKEFDFILEYENDDDIIKTEQKYNFERNESIDFISSEAIRKPVKIELTTNSSWEFRDFQTNELKFETEYEYPSGETTFESTIKSGEIRLLETGTVEELREDDNFILKNLETRRLELSKNEEGIKVHFEGNVSDIFAGPADFEKNLAPTYLEYIYHQKKLAFFWSAIVFLWGFLWSFKNTFFGK